MISSTAAAACDNSEIVAAWGNNCLDWSWAAVIFLKKQWSLNDKQRLLNLLWLLNKFLLTYEINTPTLETRGAVNGGERLTLSGGPLDCKGPQSHSLQGPRVAEDGIASIKITAATWNSLLFLLFFILRCLCQQPPPSLLLHLTAVRPGPNLLSQSRGPLRPAAPLPETATTQWFSFNNFSKMTKNELFSPLDLPL